MLSKSIVYVQLADPVGNDVPSRVTVTFPMLSTADSALATVAAV